ncbi:MULTISPECIES: DUF3927 domain-containing protein [Pectobacterium]|uniref:DUF3927 domain-containing protein n=1 Tax=Pectobacterium TaxID=122277 RepID=UPI002A838B7C|nr:DUF3927 domain-containing protein [Pectobacterium actinidiae]MDY4317431.1 DUF3927 domain-containing protein [Pectobacterium actinidiae]
MNKLRLAGVLLLAFMGVAVDFSSYLLSVVSDALFIGALVFIVWSPLMAGSKNP